MDTANFQILSLPAGSQQLFDLKLFGVRLLAVCRDGIYYNIVYHNTINYLDVWHSPVSARIKFHAPAGATNEDIYVLIKD